MTIDDQLDSLKGNKYFSHLDLKDTLHYVAADEDSVKFTSFVTPLHRFEYVYIFPQCVCAMWNVNTAFRGRFGQNKVVIRIGDIPIATETVKENLIIWDEVYDVLS